MINKIKIMISEAQSPHNKNQQHAQTEAIIVKYH